MTLRENISEIQQKNSNILYTVLNYNRLIITEKNLCSQSLFWININK